MTRNVSSGFESIVQGDVLEPFLAVDLQFDSGNVRAWTGLGTLSIGGVEYAGTASIMSISPIEETIEVAARGVQFVLTGVPSDLVSLALSEPYQGRIAKIYFGLFDTSNGAQAELIEIFSGFMDVMQIADEPGTATITISAENRLISLERPKVRRFTSQDQKRDYQADRGFDFVNDLQDKEVKWGGG